MFSNMFIPSFDIKSCLVMIKVRKVLCSYAFKIKVKCKIKVFQNVLFSQGKLPARVTLKLSVSQPRFSPPTARSLLPGG